MSDLRQIQNMLEIYYTANGGYPSSNGSSESISSVNFGNLQATQPIPQTDPSGKPYCYKSTGTLVGGAAGYYIGTQLEISSSSNSCMSSCSGSNGNTTNPNYCLSF
jgi:type II secretory pathway pseudopilin PulG